MDGFDLNTTPHINFVYDYRTPDGFLPFGYTKHSFGNVIKLKLSNIGDDHTGYYFDLENPYHYSLQRASFFATYMVERTPKTQYDLTTEVRHNINPNQLYLVVLESLNVNNLFEYYGSNKFEIEDFISPQLLELIKTYQNFKIVFMDSREGSYKHDIEFLVKINNFLNKHSIPHLDKVHISTNNNFINKLEKTLQYKTFKNRIKLYPNNYCLLTAGRFIAELKSKKSFVENDYEYSIQDTIHFNDREKYFLMYNRNPSRVHRAYFVNQLYKNNLLDNGIVSFFQNDDLDHFLNQENKDYNELSLTISDVDDMRLNYKNYTPLIIDNENANIVADYHNFLSRKDEYEKTYFTIVSETNAESQYCFITEKTIKPMMNLHPFVVLGNPHTLKVLKSYGLQTFSKWWDESYDDEMDFKIRSKMVLDIVKKLCSKSKEEWNLMLKEMQEILLFNKQHLHRLTYKKAYEKEFLKNIISNYKSL